MAFLAAFAVYLATLCPTVWVGDSGELTAAAWTLGIPHPTGYPLWLFLCKAFATVVPIGSVALRANLFSAVCAAGAAEMLYHALRRLGATRAAAFGGALALALLGPIWGEATVARTYPLAALVSATLLWLTARWIAEPRDRTLVLHQLLLGFGLANHPMVGAHLPALVAVVIGREPSAFKRPKLLAMAVLALLPGLALYGWLPWRAAANPTLEFHPPMAAAGSTQLRPGELSTWDGFRSYVTREFHQTHRWAKSAGDHVAVLGHHVKELARELTALGVALALIGAASLWRARRRSLVIGLALLWLGNLAPLSLHGAWWDIFLYTRYVTTGFVGVALLVGLGIDATSRFLAARVPLLAARPARVALACVMPLLLGVLNYPECNRREGWLAGDYARALCAEMPAHSQLLSGGDVALYPLLTLCLTEQPPPDLSLVNSAQLNGEADLMLAYVAKLRNRPPPPTIRPAYTPDDPTTTTDLGPIVRERQGLLYRLRLPDEPSQPPAPYAPPKIRGLERDDEPDPFARSMIAKIEADLADAAAVRGDFVQMRRRLERVARLAPSRPWANFLGVDTLLVGVDRRGRQNGSAEESLVDLELAQRLAERASEVDGEHGATRAPLSTAIGTAHIREAIRVKTSASDAGFRHLEQAAELLVRSDVRCNVFDALMLQKRDDEARERLARWRQQMPGDPALEERWSKLPK